MNEDKTSVFANGLLWFGAGISIAEILTGMLLAPLGMVKGAAAIIIGHCIGGIVMYYAGLIGGRTGRNAMETVELSFGNKGALLFAGLNVIQLIGWTAVMIASAAAAANTIIDIGTAGWTIVIGLLIAGWVVLGLKNLGKVNIVVIAALLILTFILSTIVFHGNGTPLLGDSLSFGSAVELAAAMPLSWLPLISDYTRTAERPQKATAMSCGAYFVASCWMFFIGMGAALFTGQDDIAAIMLQAGLGFAGIVVVLLSTVTTTFLDVFSAGVSSRNIIGGVSEKTLALLACVCGVILAIFAQAEQFQDFLYFIGSVFAPMTAILLADYFILKKDNSSQSCNWENVILWGMGVVLYRFFLHVDTPLGNTFPVVIIMMMVSIFVQKIFHSFS
ncbi:putative hydroxymethylpyrimidine transporter CytX [Megasphaera paucivorans]|uniref:Putative hydroxymethylpyrimidine transporter CytX n=1 Tax=Megasphaera paucivorans TaxID=349095 RepID=A0A1G9TPE2_9FIRM|nr:putative hydroxymethylpyrimidine transporter CytX [Megasphaera paucivorans]SDM49563.1 putative hydroxymethylpyrimidine transporter CytX [Megasphaera paucivorans]